MEDNVGTKGGSTTSAEDDGAYLSSLQKSQDAEVAKALNAMSMQERERCYHDIHGVSDVVIDETPEFLESKLAELDVELSKISKKKEAYLLADAQDKEYTNCRKLRLKFLRAESFNVQKAADHLFLYFEEKLNLFGREQKLAKDIKLGDLDAEDREYLESGVGQLVPQRDRAGRCVFIWILANGHNNGTDEKIAKIKARVLWYLLMAASEDEETQKKGMVAVLTTVGNKRPLNLKAAKRMNSVGRALPNRWLGTHFCVDKETTKNVLSLWTVLMRKRDRVRFRTHLGTHLEVRYQLMTFGIPMDMFPITSDGKFPLDNHKNWLAQRRTLETMENTLSNDDERVGVPSPLDILLGRHWEAQCHQGNLRFRNTIAKHGDAYEKAKKLEKTQIAEEVVEELRASGSRFLKSDGVGYVLVHDKVTREKVSRAFRNRRKALVSEEDRKTAIEVQGGRRGLEQIVSAFEHSPERLQEDEDYVEIKRPRREIYEESNQIF